MSASPPSVPSSSTAPRGEIGAASSAPLADPTSGARHARTLGAWFIVVLIAAIGGAMTLIKERKPAPVSTTGEAPPVVTVGVERAVRRTVPRILAVTGSITAWDPLPIGASANGLRIEQVNVEEGDRVARGEVLAVLDASVLRAQRRQLEARLAAARAALPKAVQPNRPQEIAGLRSALLQAQENAHQQEANLVQARANLENARKNHARYQQLLAQGFVTTKEFEDRDTELRRTRALALAAEDGVRASGFQVEQARQRLALAQAGGRPEDVAMAQASGDEVQALIEQVDAQIAQTVLRAPDDGLVVKRDAHIGEISTPAKTLFVLVRRNQLELRAQIPEVDLARIRVGQRVQLRTAAGLPVGDAPDRVLADAGAASAATYGRVWRINPIVDPQSRLGTARIAIPTGLGLLPGMFVRAEIDCGSESAILVPIRAVLGPAEGRYVFVLDDDKAHRRAVTTGLHREGSVQIVEGLKAGEQVVVEGGGFLTDGDRVRVGPASDRSVAPSGQPTARGVR